MSSMEDLLSVQEQISTGIEQLYSNFKKDGSDRKTPDYIKRRLDTLDGYWNEYQSNHIKLCGFGTKSNPYFTTNQFEQTGERYSNIRAALVNYTKPKDETRPSTPLIKPATPMSVSGTSGLDFSSQARGSNSKTDEMLRKQSSNFKAFEHTISNIDLDSISEKWEFDHLLRNIQSRWTTIDTLHWELDSESYQQSSEYESHFFKAEQKFNEIIKAINKKMWSVSHREKSTPKMEIPTFSGNYHQWSSFKDLFTETIHANPTLSNAQKMQFLKSKVKGEAERLIQHLTISSDNYAISWDLLNHRYNNKRLILSSHFDLMLNIPAIQHLSLNHIKKTHDVIRESLNAIKNLGVNVDSWDPLIIHLMCQKLDTETLSEYLLSVKEPKEVPKLDDFLSFLEKTFTTLETSRRKPEPKSNQNPKNHKNFNNNFNMKQSSFGRSIAQAGNDKNVYATKYYKCAICKSNNHGIFNCNKFKDLTPIMKRRTSEKLKLCENCLYCHYGNECFSEKRCRECNQAHNTLLHEAFTQHDNDTVTLNSTNANVSAPKSGRVVTMRSSHVSIQTEIPEILLATAVVRVETSTGSFINMRALLDQGSQTSLITENAAQLLGLPRQRCQGVITGIGTKQSNCKGSINIKCSSTNCHFEFNTDVLIMKSLIKNLPSYSFKKPNWAYLDHITLADPEFNVSRPVDILFGADIYSLILLEGICRGDLNHSPIAQNTRLGWILSGCARTLQCNVVINNLDEIQRFWEIEDIAEGSDLSLEDQECIQYYKTTTTRKEDGRYEVRLPLKTDFEKNLGLSKNKAVAQLKSLERKFSKNQLLEESYRSFMKEYQSMGHMIPATSSARPDFYLTHHGVERTESTTTKFRVVFNGSAKTSSGYSLNDVMKRGPNLQQDLQSLIIKWRQYQFAYTADIEMMFRQISINNLDQKLQKIIWRSENEVIQEWELTTVTYGTKAAPFLAMMTLRQLASDERSNYQNAADVLESSFYMDDLVHGTHELSAATQLRKDLISLLKSAGFNLRKWKSNVSELSDAIIKNSKQENFDFKQLETSKTLGLSWNHQQDMFMFKSKIVPTTELETKRSLLSDISKLFDPLGWLAPLSTKLKIIFQRVWLAAIEWDDPLPQDILSEWITIKNDIENINKLQVPRWLSTQERDVIELHGFCDASTKAYACVIYCKIIRGKQPIITLLVAKTRIVPCGKNITLPRLELSAAHLLSKLILKVQKCLNTYEVKTYGWSDSMIVLGWLSGDPTRWKTFVANRVRDITFTMPSTCWRYVKSEENPADCASRGLTASQLAEHSLWWQGPSWLPDFDGQCKQNEFITDQEVKKVRQINVVTEHDLNKNIIYQLLFNHSSIIKVIRIVSWMFRFIKKISELINAENIIIKQTQQFEFSKEIKSINERDQRTRWQLTQKIFEDVWKKQSEYLCQLSARSKWRQSKENLNINDVVIINDVNLPSGKWALGRIIALHPGKDGYVRVVSLKTKSGEIKRPITKISKLPVSDSKTAEPDSKIQQKQETKVKNRLKKTCASSLYNFVLMLFMFLFMLASPVQSKYQISSFNTSQGFYFDRITNIHLERDQWKLVIYYDMTPYWQSSLLLGNYINHLDGVCNSQSNKKIAQCDIILLQLRHGLNELEHYNSILLGKQFTQSARTRLPRGLINGVGFVANKLFGVLDQEFAEHYEQDIESIRQNEKHLASLWRNQTSVVEGEFNLIKRVETSIDKQRKLFNQHLNNLENSLNKQIDSLQLVSNSADFTLSSVIAQGLLASLRNIQETIINSLTNVYAGKLNFHLLTPEQLRDEMNIITGLLSRDITLPLNNLQSDVSKMYHLLSVKARASIKFIIFEVKIPLVSRDTFELYKLIPIPQRNENKMTSLVPISDYVAVIIQKDSYVPITERDLQNCIEFDQDSLLCHLNQPIHQMRSEENMCIKSQNLNKCQTKTSACKDSWITLQNRNTFLYSCCGHCSIRIICEHQITIEKLHNNGIISLSEECIIKTDSITIYAHKTQTNTFQQKADVIKIAIPQMNNLLNLSIPASSVENQSVYSENQQYFEKIDRQIKQLKESASAGVLTERISYHDVHHYVVIYLVLFAAVVGVTILVWRRRWARAASPGAPAAAPTPPARAAELDIELRETSFEPSATVRCVSESAVHQCCVRSEVENKSRSARFLNKASSPVFFKNKTFDRTL